MTKTITTAAQITDEALHAALLEFAKANVPVDVQQMLVHGYDKRNTAPHSLRNAIAAALTHLSAPYAVEVKTLEWGQHRDTWHCDKHHEYEITRRWLGEDRVVLGHFEVEILGADQFGSLDEAKAAAQADFERRTLSCVVSKPVDAAAWAQHLLSTWDQWFSCERNDEDTHETANNLMLAACFSAVAYDDAKTSPIGADKAAVDLLRIFLITLIDENSTELDPYRTKNRQKSAAVTNDGRSEPLPSAPTTEAGK